MIFYQTQISLEQLFWDTRLAELTDLSVWDGKIRRTLKTISAIKKKDLPFLLKAQPSHCIRHPSLDF